MFVFGFHAAAAQARRELEGQEKIEIGNKYFWEKRNFVFSKNSRLKSQGEKNGAMSRRRRRRTLRRCRPRDFSSRATSIMSYQKDRTVAGRVALGAGSRARKSTGVPRPQASVARHLLRHVLCDANFSRRTSPPPSFLFSCEKKQRWPGRVFNILTFPSLAFRTSPFRIITPRGERGSKRWKNLGSKGSVPSLLRWQNYIAPRDFSLYSNFVKIIRAENIENAFEIDGQMQGATSRGRIKD